MTSNNLLSFSNKIVLITGAASGFGLLLSRDFAELGAKLVLGDIDQNGLEQLLTQLKTDYPDCEVITQHCDVSQQDDCESLVKAAVSQFGQLDIALNNAGIAHNLTPFHELGEADFDQQFAVNTKGVFFGMKHQIKQMMKQKHGIILNTSSMAGLGGAPKLAAYSAAKHAVIALTKTAAVEYAKFNIRINAICPFFSPTPLMTNSESMDNADTIAFLAKGSPMKRLADPQEVVNAMILACSSANSYMTGQSIAIDGGVSAL